MCTIFNRFQKFAGNKLPCIRIWAVILVVTISFQLAQAQYIEITVSVTPPYTNKVYDYIGQPNKIIAFFTNNTGADKDFYILGSFSGTSVNIYTDPNYKMPTPIFLRNGEAKYMTQMNVEDVFNEEHLIFQGVTKNELLFGSGLIEDDYRLCLQAYEYADGTLISPPGMGCSPQFKVTNLEPPVILYPICGQKIIPTTPQQMVNFVWTMPPGAAANTQYNLKIVEVLPTDRDINDAINSATHPVFFEKTITATMYYYGPSDPSLVSGSTYAFVVTAIDPNNLVTFRNLGMSEVCSFIYEAPVMPPPVQQETDCQDTVDMPVIANTNPSTKSGAAFKDKFVSLGKFKMKILSASGSGSALSGTGSVVVDWLHTPVKVEFNNIKINTADQVYEGFVLAQKDDPPDNFPTQWLLNGAGSFDWNTKKIKLLDKFLQSNAADKLIKEFDLNERVNRPLKLPLGLNDDKGYTIAVTEMKFEPSQAKLNCVALFPLPDEADSLGFVASGIIFSPGMPSVASGKLGLLDDVKFRGKKVGDSYTVVFKKVQETSGGTYLSWDCKGFQELFLDMDVFFPRSWLKPEPDNGTDSLKTNIKITITDWNDWMILATFPTASITGTQGMIIEAPHIWYDHSDKRNPEGIQFPSNYPADAEKSVRFRGFFLPDASLILPDNFRTFSEPEQDISIAIKNMIINNNGITGRIFGENIYNFPDGNISGLGATIDTAKITLICSSLDTAFFKGRIILPVSENDPANALNYKALLNTGSGFQFTIVPAGPIKAKLFADALLTLSNTSTINLTINENTKFSVNLNGNFEFKDITVETVKNVKMKMTFQNLGLMYDESITDEPFTLNAGEWSFSSPQHYLANFPVSLTDVKFIKKARVSSENEKMRKALSFSINLDLEEKITGKTSLSIIGAIVKDPVSKMFSAKFISAELDTIRLSVDLAAVELDGKIVFFHDDETYGNGFSGSIKATFNSIKMEVSTKLRMGSTNYNNDDYFYRYWFVDAKVILPQASAIPFLPGVAFYGFGVGASKRIEIVSLPPLDLGNIENASQVSQETIPEESFKPNIHKGLDFKALAVIGTYPEPRAFNSDASLSGDFSPSGGLNKIDFNVDFWCTAELTERGAASIKGNAYIGYVVPDKIFNMKLNAQIHKGYIESNALELSLMINGKSGNWYFICGTPKKVNSVTILGVNAWEYVVFGNYINDFLTTGFQDCTIIGLKKVGFSTFPLKTQVPNEASAGKGFAFGAGVNFQVDKSRDIHERAQLKYGAYGGFEVNLSMLQYDPNAVCGDHPAPIGFRSWYCNGMVAAWFGGYVKVHVDRSDKICFEHGGPCMVCCNSCKPPEGCDYTFADLKLGLWAEAGFPDPVWIKAAGSVSIEILHLITWKGEVELNYGTECYPELIDKGQTYVQEDATMKIGNLIISTDPAAGSGERFDPGKTIRAIYGLKPDDAFDIPQKQSDGSIISRTFQVRCSAYIIQGAPAPIYGTSGGSEGGSIQNKNLSNTLDISVTGIEDDFTPGSYVPVGIKEYTPPQEIKFGLIRSPEANSSGEYEYWLYRSIADVKQFRNLEDTTNYTLNINAVLWELEPNSDGSWVKARSANGNEISENRVIKFRTGRLEASTQESLIAQESQSYQLPPQYQPPPPYQPMQPYQAPSQQQTFPQIIIK